MTTIDEVIILSLVRERIERGDDAESLIDILVDIIAATEPALGAELFRLIEAYFARGEWRPPARSWM